MLVVMLIAGIGLLLAGLLMVGFGIQLDLSLGNTLILTGAIGACTGIMMLGLWTVVRELRDIGRRLGPAIRSGRAETASAALTATSGDQAPEDGGFAPEDAQGEPGAAPPWRDRGRQDPAADHRGAAAQSNYIPSMIAFSVALGRIAAAHLASSGK